MKYLKAINTLKLITCYVLFAVSGILFTLSCMFSTQGNMSNLGRYRFIQLTYLVHPNAISLYLWLMATQVAELKSLAHKPMISYSK